MVNTLTVTIPNYTDEDHHTWATLYARQWALVEKIACHLFVDGLPKLQLDPLHVPDAKTVSARLQHVTGWTLGDAQNEYLSATEWFEQLQVCRFPVTNYIRRPDEIEFTPLPDLFHEYFGHLAFMVDPHFAETARMFGELYLSSSDERQHIEIQRLWWFTTEFGLVRENGDLKLLGAGLLSSPGELQHALDPATVHEPFEIRRVTETPLAKYSYHDRYFVVDSVAQIRQIVLDYARLEGLPLPVA